ncbi:MAG: DUF2529 family protein, partial [candidate division KSB1 bacterium]|nr:DUF2529 family protein [candidate division KSB1 bacterium]
ADRAVELRQRGGNLYCHIVGTPVFPIETRSDRAGNPGVLPQWGLGQPPQDYLQLRAGDFYFTNEVTDAVFRARQRGVYVVGLSVPYLPSKFSLLGKLIIQPDWYTIEDVSNVVLYSQVPYQDGLVFFPEIPVVPVCPGSAISEIILYWMMVAEITHKLTAEITYPFVSRARDYLETVIDRLYQFEKQLGVIRTAASQMAENIGTGHKLYVYSNPPSLIAEACNRASGLMLTQPLELETLQKRDNLIIGAESSNDSNDMIIAEQARNKGAFVVAICPFHTEGDSSGLRLSKLVDIAIDNLSGESGGVISLANRPEKICPTSGLLNLVLLWMLTAELIGRMIRLGLVPYVYMGTHLQGGKEYNDAIRPFFLERGY